MDQNLPALAFIAFLLGQRGAEQVIARRHPLRETDQDQGGGLLNVRRCTCGGLWRSIGEWS